MNDMSKPVINKLKYQHRQNRIWHTKYFKDRKREQKKNPSQFEQSQYDWLLDEEDYWS